MKAVLITLSLLATTALANEDSDKNKFINGLTKRYIELLCETDYLACINRTKSECVSSVVVSTSVCPLDSFYKTTIADNNEEDLQQKEMEKEGYLFGKCVSDKFFNNLNITEKTVKDCEASLPALGAAN